MAKQIKTHCARFDHGGCGLVAFVEDGRLVKVLPDKDDDYSKGYCCAKGLASVERVCHPDRLRRPLVRKGKRGAGDWEPVSWDRALDILSSEFAKAIGNGGPESVAFMQGAPKGLEFFILMRLANLLKTPTVGAAQHVCHMPREQLAVATCGFFPVPDYDAPTECILLWGSDPERTNEEGMLGGRFREALKHGPKLIVVDPLRTGPAKRSDLWLQVRPGTDDLLAAGLLHVIIEENLFDRDFVEQWTVGFEDLREAVRPFTPGVVSSGTGVSGEQMAEAARLYARSRPALLHWGNAIEHTANSSQTCRSLVLLMALTGNLEAPGGNIKTELPELIRPADLICLKQFPGRIEKLLNRHYGLIPRLITTPNWIVFRSILDQSPYAIKCLYMQGNNPLVSSANPEEARDALERLDFLAVSDIFMTPSAALADLVLPAATNLEFNDIGHYGLPHGHVFARPKAVDPEGDVWPDVKILNEWGKRMGFGSFFWESTDAMMEAVLAPSGLTYEQFAAKGRLDGPRMLYSYREKGFATPSGKVELRSGLLEKGGYSPVPVVAEHATTDERFPFLLTSRKPRHFFHSAYRQINRLRDLVPEPKVLIHPDTASALGILEGMEVRIVTASGSIMQRAKFSEDLSPGVISADFGWWFPEKSEEAFGWKRSNINCAIGSDGPKDPVLGTIQLRAIPCRLEKILPGEQ
jgi:anaerobic selenocysteine-containing dehydrogenase